MGQPRGKNASQGLEMGNHSFFGFVLKAGGFGWDRRVGKHDNTVLVNWGEGKSGHLGGFCIFPRIKYTAVYLINDFDRNNQLLSVLVSYISFTKHFAVWNIKVSLIIKYLSHYQCCQYYNILSVGLHVPNMTNLLFEVFGMVHWLKKSV